MISRRHILGSSVMAGAALTTTAWASTAWAKTGEFAPRGRIDRLTRVPMLSLESRDEFNMSYRVFVNGELQKAARERAVAILRDNRMDPAKEVALMDAVRLFENDPVLAANMHGYVRGQQVMWADIREMLYAHADQFMAEMETADKAGPGKLELNPKMVLPAYTKEEIHNQPGGYVGDEFAGHLYYWGTNNFWMGRNHQDEMHGRMAAEHPIPADGKVKRILDLGCGDGRLTMALKDRYPEAEVWGLDVGGPMVRFAHMRANKLGNGANFAQRLAEDTGFPDGYFDIVTSFLLFHEVSGAANKKIIAETARILRPGGITTPGDIRIPATPMTGYRQFFNWWNTRWNYEVWMLEHIATDYEKVFAANGFAVSGNEKTKSGGTMNLVGTKVG